jgi:hypothetical protein
MGFEDLDSLLGDVATMIVRGDKLLRHTVLLDSCLEFRRTLVIKHMMLGIYSFLIEAVDEALIFPYISPALLSFMAATRIPPLLMWTRTMMYRLPLLNFFGKRPV